MDKLYQINDHLTFERSFEYPMERFSTSLRYILKGNTICILSIFVMFFACFDRSSAQSIELGLGGGLSLYQGDLTSYRFKEGLVLKIHPSFNAALRAEIDERWAVSFAVFSSRISGADSLSLAPSTKARNLDFRSSLAELALRVEWYPLKSLSPYTEGINPYLSIGLAGFKFSPMTTFQNREVALQPLGTEGQGLPGNPSPYALTQIAIPIGGGLRLRIADGVFVHGFIYYSLTGTDYIDDVSTLYYPPELLESGAGLLSAQLSNRSIDAAGNQIDHTGKKRGNASIRDAYLNGGVMVSINLFDISSRAACPSF